jgi:hypothetical protein
VPSKPANLPKSMQYQISYHGFSQIRLALPLLTSFYLVQILTPRFCRLEDWPRHLGSAPRTSRALNGTRRGHPSTASCLYSALFCSRANGEIDLEDILQEDSVERVAGLPCSDLSNAVSALCAEDLLFKCIPVHHSCADNDGEFQHFRLPPQSLHSIKSTPAAHAI